MVWVLLDERMVMATVTTLPRFVVPRLYGSDWITGGNPQRHGWRAPEWTDNLGTANLSMAAKEFLLGFAVLSLNH